MTERAAYIGRIRNLARAVAQSYFDSRARLGFPMAPKDWADEVLTAENLAHTFGGRSPSSLVLGPQGPVVSQDAVPSPAFRRQLSAPSSSGW